MYYVVIVHPDFHGVLATESGSLPTYHWEEEYDFFCDSYQACERLKSELGASFDLNFLRYEAPGVEDTNNVVLLEIPFDPAPPAPPNYKWVSPEDVENITVSPLNENVTMFLGLYKTHTVNVNERRLRPYSKHGWFASASEWTRTRVEELTGSKVVKVLKLRAASNACVLRAETMSGLRFFMKSVRKEPHDEVEITNAIHFVMNDQFGDILYIDADRRFMLLRDYGNPMVGKDCYLSCNGDTARNVMRQWVDIQKKSVTLVEELCIAGVQKRGKLELQAELEAVASDIDWFEAELAALKRCEVIHEFTHTEYKARFLSTVTNDLQTVEKLNLPLCLVHGDLLPVNIVKRPDGRFTFFDFEGSVVSYPFLDALSFLFYCKELEDVLLFEDISFYLDLWGLTVSEKEANFILQAMKNVEMYIGILFRYTCWRNAEETARKFFYTEMGTPVYRIFNIE